jgi:hypothetical protein
MYVVDKGYNINGYNGCITLWPCHLHEKKGGFLRQKQELWKLKYCTMQTYNLPKKSSKRNQNPSRDIITLFAIF